jgi:predicted NAD/FAD-dependent oxidoreductase
LGADVTIIGAGLAGLTCARDLIARGLHVELLEASDRPGGRVRTDLYRGFLLDRGFQVLLSAYPECQKALDYAALDLQAFYPGALVWFGGKFHRVADPWRHPVDAVASLNSPIGSLMDKLRVGGLRDSVRQGTVEGLFGRPETSTLESLRKRGFSASMIARFFRPFFGGIFLEKNLETSSRMFEFVFRMFSEGDTAVPAKGMEAISRQLAWGIPVTLNTRVTDVKALDSRAVVVATEGNEAARLTGTASPSKWRSVQCFYFAADQAPVKDNMIVLDGEGRGPVNNLCVISQVARSYAPAGASLISASVIGSSTEEQVREHMRLWFGADVKRWLHLRTYDVAYAQPDQSGVPELERPVRLGAGLYVCGDHVETASLNGAIHSGKRAAAAVLTDLS